MQFVLATQLLDPFKYAGSWHEVASYKQGFAPLSEYTCLDNNVVLEYDPDNEQFDAAFQCRRLDKKITGIKGIIICPPAKGFEVSSTCSVRFPSAPYVPPGQHKVLETDYESYAIVEGAGDKSFVQIMSRFAHPGLRFIDEKKEILRRWGYDPDEVHMSIMTK